MFTYHYDTFIKRFRIYRDGNFIGSLLHEGDVLKLWPKAVKV